MVEAREVAAMRPRRRPRTQASRLKVLKRAAQRERVDRALVAYNAAKWAHSERLAARRAAVLIGMEVVL